MKEYDIEVKEVLSRVVRQKGENIDDAINIVQGKYDTREIELNYDDLHERSFANSYSKPLTENLNLNFNYDQNTNLLTITDGNHKQKYSCDTINNLISCFEVFTADYLEEQEITAKDIDNELEMEMN